MTVHFFGRDVEVKDLIAMCLAENYLMYGFADDGEANMVADRLLTVLDELGLEVAKKSTAPCGDPQH